MSSEGGGVDGAKAFGRRLREVRSWRELNLREAAGLAGLSFSFWGQVERGEKAVNSRKTLEAMAGALRVHLTELTGQPYTLADPTTSQAHAVVAALEGALNDYDLGERPEDIRPRPWEAIAADLDRLNRDLWPRADYSAQGTLLPQSPIYPPSLVTPGSWSRYPLGGERCRRQIPVEPLRCG
ncbi:MAG: helix-turn-helix domain-containing protein [Pseudonocardiaceae bacterium]